MPPVSISPRSSTRRRPRRRRPSARARRDERGQGSLENLGVVVLATILVAAATGAVAARSDGFRAAVSSAVCQVIQLGGGGACEESGDDGDTTPTEDDTAPVTDDRSPVCEIGGTTGTSMPVPDSTSVEVEDGPASTTVSVNVGEDTPAADGTNWTDVTFEIQYEEGAELSLRGLQGFRGGLEGFVGSGTSVGVTLPSDLADRLQDGDSLPDPLVPASIPPGVTVTLTQEAYVGANASAAYRGLVGAMQYETSGNVSVAVTALPDGQVQVSVGTADAISHLSRLGIGSAETNIGLVSSTDIQDFEVQQYTVDLESSDGLAAYYALLDGDVEAASQSAGVVDQSTVTGGSYATQNGVVASLGPASMQENFYSNDVRSTLTENADGTTSATVQQVINGQVRVYTETYDADGTIVDVQTQVRMSDVSADEVNGYNDLWGGQDAAEIDGPVNMVFDYDRDDLEQIRSDAIDMLVARLNNGSETSGQLKNYYFDGYDSEVTREDVEAWLASDPPADELQMVLENAGGASGTSDVTQTMAAVLTATAESPDDPWATWAAFTDGLDLAGPSGPTTLMYWAAEVAEANGTAYDGFGDVLCVGVT